MILVGPFIQVFVGMVIVQSVIYGETRTSLKNWRYVETIAETNPFIVALLNNHKQYTCTGSIIDKRSAVTSGNCISTKPRYIVVGAAVFGSKTNKNNIFDVSHTVLHSDYIFELRAVDPNVTKMHSNIGLVFVSRPILDFFIPAADIGEVYATELKEKNLHAIGYGPDNEYSNNLILQQQDYQQAPCSNPKWYYCICGIEYLSYEDMYLQKFGSGGPVMFDRKLVGISAAPCGLLTLRTTGYKYNIFTILGPYLPWIQKNGLNKTLVPRAITTDSGATSRTSIDIVNILISAITMFLSKVVL